MIVIFRYEQGVDIIDTKAIDMLWVQYTEPYYKIIVCFKDDNGNLVYRLKRRKEIDKIYTEERPILHVMKYPIDK